MGELHEPPSERVRVRRGAHRADYDPATIEAILRAGLVAHVGLSTPDGPIVLPMAYGVDHDTMYLHGAAANALLRGAEGSEVCATVTIVDGLVVARTPFHHSMNYRSVVVRGTARAVTEPDEVVAALRLVSDHVVATWSLQREPTAGDLRRTRCLALPLDEASAKVRSGDPMDEPDDLGGPHWAGVVPIIATFGPPRPAADLRAGIAVPEPVADLEGTAVSPASR